MRNDAERARSRSRLMYVVLALLASALLALVVLSTSDSSTPPKTPSDGISMRSAGTERGSPIVLSPSGMRFRVRLLDAQGHAVQGAVVTFSAGDIRTASTERGKARTAAVITPPGFFAVCPQGNPTPLECRMVTVREGYATSSVFTPTATNGVFTVTATAVVDGHQVRFVFTVELPDAANPPAPTTTTLPTRRATTATTLPATPATPATRVTPATPTTTSPTPPPPTLPPGTFTISGDITVPLLPGGSYPIDLVVTNPRNSAITIAAGGVSISIATGQTGCAAATNFVITHGLLDPITIPAGSTRSLSQLGVPIDRWPVLSMIETNTNQDACRGAVIVLTYSGTATG